MNEKKIFYLKKIIFTLLFLVFWVINGIHIFKLDNNRELAIGILYIIIFLPITISILLDYEVFSLFIIIIYEAAMLLMGIILLSSGLASKELGTIDLFGVISEILFSLFLIASSIQYLANKNHTLIIPCIIFSVAHVSFVIASFIINGEFTFDTFYDFLRNFIIILVFAIYIITFPYVQLKIFKDEK